ncbi:CTP synthase [candidate division TA06 bacterium DG_78]|uniref:CTP synthase n=1 Tax=candidate division TA06 bacterium DG_78 TaxID=1703772 RepID=A0A0S7Y9Z4_UNCT6|nr:MAG: CTP synthase [candidate division TA06 bacterium DG_78]
MNTKYIFITGGVVSSLGKGVATSSIGLLLKSYGLKVTLQKIDPYINVDPGTMNPYQHGEVFVTTDGAECDLDLGHYERFLNEALTRDSNITTGQIYYSVIEKERRGEYLGKTVQVVPHITDEIKSKIMKLANTDSFDVVITEIGGTVGDIEGQPFLEAVRQMRLDLGKQDTLYIHLTLVPFIKAAREFKTKPTQHSVRELRAIGIQPDILLCRSDSWLTGDERKKISLFCNVPVEAVIDAIDVECIYEIPLILHQQNLDKMILSYLGIEAKEPDLEEWRLFVENAKSPTKTVEIAICGKYIELRDAYKSIMEALYHAAVANDARLKLKWIDTDRIEDDIKLGNTLAYADGILVPGGFGMRGVEGKIKIVKYAREMKKPFLGICLGMQCQVIEYARNICGMQGANSTEFDDSTAYPVIDLLPGQKRIKNKGGTMRLGDWPCRLETKTLAQRIYRKDLIHERHRHRYEVNPKYIKALTKKGLIFSGTSPNGKLMEIAEITDHPFFIGTQFHPEFTSRPLAPNPIFYQFIKKSLKKI